MGSKVSKALQHPDHRENLLKLFDDLDEDKDGFIDSKELKNFSIGVLDYLHKIKPEVQASELVGTMAGWKVRRAMLLFEFLFFFFFFLFFQKYKILTKKTTN